jgi:sugar lactone lactonase YvrE
VELSGGRVHRVTKDGQFSTVAGTGAKGDAGDGGPASKAVFNGMHNLAISRSGDIFLADTWNQKVRRIEAKTGVVSTVAGTGRKGFSGEGGDATRADCGGIYCVALEPNGKRMFLADLDNRRIRAVTLTDDGDAPRGAIATLAGNGQKGVPQDGSLAKDSPLVDPRAVACDSRGNVYVLERGGHALRVVDSEGRIRTVAGTGKAGPPKDDVPALEAALNGPKHLCIDRHDDVIIADAENNVVRKLVVKENRVLTIAGTGQAGTGRLGGLKETELARPHGVFVDAKGTLYVVDSYHDRVLRAE